MDFSIAAIPCREEIFSPPFIDVIPPETLDRTLRETHIVHTIPGRVRLRIPALRWAHELTGSLEALLGAQPGITGVRVNRWCHSVTVNYDSLQWTSDTVSAFLQQLPRQQIKQYELLRPQDEAVRASWIQPSTCWRVAGYLTLIFGIILFLLPMVPGGTPLLFLSTVCFSMTSSHAVSPKPVTNP
jgi:Cu2+-exporting ATPase